MVKTGAGAQESLASPVIWTPERDCSGVLTVPLVAPALNPPTAPSGNESLRDALRAKVGIPRFGQPHRGGAHLVELDLLSVRRAVGFQARQGAAALLARSPARRRGLLQLPEAEDGRSSSWAQRI